MGWVTILLQLAPVITQAIQAGKDAQPLVSKLVESIRGGAPGPTQAQLDELTAFEKTLRDELQAPLDE